MPVLLRAIGITDADNRGKNPRMVAYEINLISGGNIRMKEVNSTVPAQRSKTCAEYTSGHLGYVYVC